ncbi:MAG: hypothetical protein KF681_12325 [Bdellovibrionaceae bacterium]|nr:hypothetical protein [Pseudobdellovibrionaceae bacterium]
MKKVGDLMKDMGFREDAPQSLKEAFIKNLIKAATGAEVQTPSEKNAERTKKWMDAQLSFDFGPDGKPPKKVG